LSTVTAAPLGGASSSAARAGERQSKPAAIRTVSFGARSRAAKAGIGQFPLKFRVLDTRKRASQPSAKKSPLRPADGLRPRRFERQRNTCEFVRAGDMPRDRGID